MNLIIFIDYADNSFEIVKNRWGQYGVNLPLSLLGPFLYHPEITDEDELIAEIENKRLEEESI